MLLCNLPRARVHQTGIETLLTRGCDTPTIMALVSAVLKTEGVFRSLQAVLHCNQYLSGRFLMSRLLCSSPSDPLPTRVQQAFKMLGLEEEHGGSVQQVRKAFIRMVKRFHPDAQTTEASAEEFAKVLFQCKLILRHKNMYYSCY